MHGESVPNTMKINGTETSDPQKIADSFNNFFGTIAEKTKSKIVHTNKAHTEYLKNPNNRSLFLRPVTILEIHNIIMSLDKNKANGPASIPTNILKILVPHMSVMISKIINLTFSTGIFPDCLKYADIVPIHKKDSKLLVENYRPISLLSNINKVFEKTIQNRLYSFLEESRSLYKLQFGFRNKHSTDHALILITEKIRDALDKGEFSCGTFVDLQKAFDTVDHNILLKKLDHYGVRGIANNLFKSYLNNRYHSVQILNRKSRQMLLQHGVPQGSVLGPLLFLIYINDLHNAIKNSQVFHFADDTSLVYSDVSLKKVNKHVNQDLTLLNHWLRANKICLNAKKTEIVIFRPKQKIITKKLNFRLSGQKLKLTTNVRYLGVRDRHKNNTT